MQELSPVHQSYAPDTSTQKSSVRKRDPRVSHLTGKGRWEREAAAGFGEAEVTGEFLGQKWRAGGLGVSTLKSVPLHRTDSNGEGEGEDASYWIACGSEYSPLPKQGEAPTHCSIFPAEKPTPARTEGYTPVSQHSGAEAGQVEV